MNNVCCSNAHVPSCFKEMRGRKITHNNKHVRAHTYTNTYIYAQSYLTKLCSHTLLTLAFKDSLVIFLLNSYFSLFCFVFAHSLHSVWSMRIFYNLVWCIVATLLLLVLLLFMHRHFSKIRERAKQHQRKARIFWK